MYDRLTIGVTAAKLEQQFEAKFEENYDPTYNAAPTQKVPVITSSKPKLIQLFNWGLSPKLSNNKTISTRLFNVPLHLATSRPVYKKALIKNRCLILVDGFYAWKKMGKKQQIPHFIYAPDNRPFGIAGIWEEYEDFDGALIKSFNLITRESREPLNAVQEDIPVILDKKSIELWLSEYSNEDDIHSILEAFPDFSLNYHPVSPLISNLKIYDQSLIEPTQQSDQHGNYTLF